MARQLVADIYGCDTLIDDPEAVKKAAREAVAFVGAEIVEECVHEFEPIGVTYFAVITTSHFSVHTWPEYGYAAVDIFSCSDSVVYGISDKLKTLFKAKEIKVRVVDRNIGDRP